MPELVALYFAEAAVAGTAAEAAAAGALTAAEFAGATAATASVGAGIGAAILKGVASSVVSMALQAAFATRSASGAQSVPLVDQSRTISGVRAAAEWQVVYGQVRKGGNYIYRSISDANISTVTEDYVITSDATVTLAAGADTISITEVQALRPPELAEEWYAYDGFDATGGTPGPDEYHHASGVLTFHASRIGANVRVQYTASGTAVSGGKYLHLVLVLAAHQCEAVDAVYFGDEEVELDEDGYALGKYAGHVYIEKYLGTASQTASAALIDDKPDEWTADHRGRGHCYLYIRLLRNTSLFPTGVPNITALVSGRNKVYDPRDASTGYTDNPALCVADYLAHPVWGLGAAYSDEIDDTQLGAAANACDEAVTLAAGGTESRYTLNGVISTLQSPQDIIQRMLTAMVGRVVYSGGAWHMHAGVYEAPALAFDEGDLAGGLQVTPMLSAREKFNAVKGVYFSPDNNWIATDFPPVRSASALAEDNDELNWREIELPFTISASMAQRIAKIHLLRTRQQMTVLAPMKMQAYRAKPPDVIELDSLFFGWSGKAFEIQEMSFTFAETLGVKLALRETDESVYDWDASEEQAVDPAPNTRLSNPFVVGAPGAPEAEVTIYRAFDGGARAKAVVTWTPSSDSQAVSYELQWQRVGETQWQGAPGLTAPGYEILDIDADNYLLRVRALSAIGVASLWAQSEITFTGLSAPPAAVEWFVIDGATLSWRAPDDLDVSGYRLRFHYGTNTSWGNANPLHGGLITESPFVVIPRPSGRVTLMIKPVDALGTESVSPAYIFADMGDSAVANIVETIDLAALGWPGTITQGTVSGGNIVADNASGLMWAPNDQTAMWTYDTAAMWYATVYKALTYEASIVSDEAGDGSVMTLAHDVTGSAYSIEYRRNAPDAMWSYDTEPMWTGDANAMWGTADSWQAWPGALNVIADEIYDFRVSVAQSGTQGVIAELTFTIDMPDIREEFQDVVISSGGTRLSITNTYRAIKTVHVTVQSDGNGGIGERVIDKSATLGPQIKVYDAAGNAVMGLIDATIEGY